MSAVRDSVLGCHPWLKPNEVDRLENMILVREVDMRNEMHAKVRENDQYWISKLLQEREAAKTEMAGLRAELDRIKTMKRRGW